MKMQYPITRKRGGSIFTLIIFVMMLLSTALMYYYFQRSRSLERELYALQNGEALPTDSGEGLFGFIGWNEAQSDDVEGAVNQSPSQEEVTSAGASEPAPAGTTPVTASSAVNQKTEMAHETNQAATYQETNASESGAMTHETLAPVDRYSTAEAAETGESPSASNENAPEDDATGNEQEAAESSEPIESEGQSLYNMDPPTVRVRAPRR